jgi:polysaccharide export outer membrane protein
MLQTSREYPISTFEQSKIEYLLQPFDIISLRVNSNLGESFFVGSDQNNSSYQKNQQGFEFIIEHDGTIKLPMVGRLNISGKTVREAENFLENEFKNYIVNPYILLSVTNRKVLIYMNSGTSAHIVNLPSENFTLLEAIASVGGMSNISKAYKIKLIRGNVTNNPEIFTWNISTIEDLKQSNLYLENNDIIYIESKKQIVTKILKEIAPYLTLFTTALSIYGIFFK